MTTDEFLQQLIDESDDPFEALKDLEKEAARLAGQHILWLSSKH